MTLTSATTLIDMRNRVFEVNRDNGWFDDSRHFDDDIALSLSEVLEMFEAYRDWGFVDKTDEKCATCANAPGNRRPYGDHICKPQGFGSEAADVLVRLLDTSHRYPEQLNFQWDTLHEVEDHPDFDSTRTVGCHIRRLCVLINRIGLTGAGNRNLNGTLAYLAAWCRHLDIDLESEFERKLAYNATRGYKHGNKLL